MRGVSWFVFLSLPLWGQSIIPAFEGPGTRVLPVPPELRVHSIHAYVIGTDEAFDPDVPGSALTTDSVLLKSYQSVIIKFAIHNPGTPDSVWLEAQGYYGLGDLYQKRAGHWQHIVRAGTRAWPSETLDHTDSNLRFPANLDSGENELLLRMEAMVDGYYNTAFRLQSANQIRESQHLLDILLGLVAGALLVLIISSAMAYRFSQGQAVFLVFAITSFLALLFVVTLRLGWVGYLLQIPSRKMHVLMYLVSPMLLFHYNLVLTHLLPRNSESIAYLPGMPVRIEFAVISSISIFTVVCFFFPTLGNVYWYTFLGLASVQIALLTIRILINARSLLKVVRFFPIGLLFLLVIFTILIIRNVIYDLTFDLHLILIALITNLIFLWLDLAIRGFDIISKREADLEELNSSLTRRNLSLDRSYSTLRQYAEIVSHLMRRPVANISQIIESEAPDLDMLRRSSRELDTTFLRLQDYLDVHLAIDSSPSESRLPEMMLDIFRHFHRVYPSVEAQFTWTTESAPITFHCNKKALHGLLSELFLNAIQHTEKSQALINWRMSGSFLLITLEQNLDSERARHTVRKFEGYRVGRSGVSIGFGIIKLAGELLSARIHFTAVPGEYPLHIEIGIPLQNQSV